MTTVLLDTHTLVWAASSPDRLGDDARRLIVDPATRLLVSAATAWEIATKVRLGRVPEAAALAAQYPAVLDRLRAIDRPITKEDALHAGALPWEHRDPFDRILAAQAMLSSIPLVSRDRAFGGLPGLMTIW